MGFPSCWLHGAPGKLHLIGPNSLLNAIFTEQGAFLVLISDQTYCLGFYTPPPFLQSKRQPKYMGNLWQFWVAFNTALVVCECFQFWFDPLRHPAVIDEFRMLLFRMRQFLHVRIMSYPSKSMIRFPGSQTEIEDWLKWCYSEPLTKTFDLQESGKTWGSRTPLEIGHWNGTWRPWCPVHICRWA